MASRGPGGGLDKLDRFLSKAGALSRGEARARVKNGEVLVNGRPVRDPWFLVEPGRDRVEVEGIGEVRLVDWAARPPEVVIYNKPEGVVVTLRSDDPGLAGRQSLNEALPLPWREQLAPHVPALRPVGRLDAPSVGLLLLTDSSAMAARLTEPGFCEKEYLLRVQPAPSEKVLQRLRAGVMINDKNPSRGATKPCGAEIVRADDASAVVRFTIREGRNRQLRRMCATVGLEVCWLMRVRMGPVLLGDLQLGEARAASEQELRALKEAMADHR